MSTKPVLRYTFLAHLPDTAPPRRVSGGAGSQSTRSQRAANAGLPGGGQSTRPRMAAKKGYRAAAKARDPGERPKQDCRATGGVSDRETRRRRPGARTAGIACDRKQEPAIADVPSPDTGSGCRARMPALQTPGYRECNFCKLPAPIARPGKQAARDRRRSRLRCSGLILEIY